MSRPSTRTQGPSMRTVVAPASRVRASASSRSRPRSTASRPTTRYIRPLSTNVRPSASATRRPTADLPEPTGPSIATIIEARGGKTDSNARRRRVFRRPSSRPGPASSDRIAWRGGSGSLAHRLELLGPQPPLTAGPQPAQADGAEPGALELAHGVPDRIQHPPHLAVAALADDQPHARRP